MTKLSLELFKTYITQNKAVVTIQGSGTCESGYDFGFNPPFRDPAITYYGSNDKLYRQDGSCILNSLSSAVFIDDPIVQEYIVSKKEETQEELPIEKESLTLKDGETYETDLGYWVKIVGYDIFSIFGRTNIVIYLGDNDHIYDKNGRSFVCDGVNNYTDHLTRHVSNDELSIRYHQKRLEELALNQGKSVSVTFSPLLKGEA